MAMLGAETRENKLVAWKRLVPRLATTPLKPALRKVMGVSVALISSPMMIE